MLPNGQPLGALLTEGAPFLQTRTTTEDSETVGKMVDFGLTIPLSIKDQDTMSAGFTTLRHYEQSVDQSVSFVSYCPLFLNIELQKTQSDRDPQVQLAIWALAGLKKNATPWMAHKYAYASHFYPWTSVVLLYLP